MEILPYENLKRLMAQRPGDFFLDAGAWGGILPDPFEVVYGLNICRYSDTEFDAGAKVRILPRSKLPGAKRIQMEQYWTKFAPLRPATATVRWRIGDTVVNFDDGQSVALEATPKAEETLKQFAQRVRERLQDEFPRAFVYAIEEDGAPPVILETGSVDAVCTSALIDPASEQLAAANIAVPTLQEARAVYAALVTRRTMTLRQGMRSFRVDAFGQKGFAAVQDLRPYGHRVITLTVEHPRAGNPAEQGEIPAFYVVAPGGMDFDRRLWERLQLGLSLPLPEEYKGQIIRAAYHWNAIRPLERLTDAGENAPGEYVGVKVSTDVDQWSRVLHDVLN